MADSTWIDALKELQECVQDERFDDAVSHCRILLEHKDELPPSLVPVVQETHLKCELHRGNYEQVSKITESSSLKAYAFYRLRQYDKARNACQGDDMIAQHVLAQSLFHLNDSEGALQSYQRLLQETQDKEERIQVRTNVLAVATSNATPYVADENPIGLDTEHTADMDGTSYDLLYNLATYQLLTSSVSCKNPRALLQEAHAACLATLKEEGMSAAEIASEVASIDVQLEEWSLLWKGIPAETVKEENVPPAVSSVQTVNRARSLKTLPASCPTNWMALQQRLYYYKRAILQLQASLYTDCHDTCQLLLQSLSTNSHKKKASTGLLPPVPSKADEAWWKARVYVLEAHCLYQQSETEEAIALLQERLDILKHTSGSSKSINHATAHVQLHLAHIKEETQRPQQIIQLLQELPESIRSRKAVTATLVTLYQELGQTDQATALLKQSEGLADFYMSQGKYREAAELYESSGEGAQLVLALSYFDPVRAQQVWEELGVDDCDENEMNGEELEARELPRFKSNKVVVVRISEEDGKKKRSHEAVLRRRARKREEYLKKNDCSSKKLDPERWLPKHERSYYARRRRNRKGAQGQGVSEKDAAKLDVAARVARGVESGSGPSTAHMEVAGGNKRGGRRR